MKNVIIIIVDALRKDTAANKGIMPYFNTLEGIHYKNAITNAPSTWGALPLLFTGNLPFKKSGKAGLTAEMQRQSIANVARKNNFNTIGVTANAVTSRYFNAGFDQFEDFLVYEKYKMWWFIDKLIPTFVKKSNTLRKIGKKVFAMMKHEHSSVQDKIRAKQVIEKFKAAKLEKKNFIFLHLIEPHMPYAPINRVKTEKKKLNKLNLKCFMTMQDLKVDEKTYLRKMYDEEAADADTALKKIINHLKKKNLYDDSLIIVTADHGESLGEKGYWGHNGTKAASEELINIPLVITGGQSKKATTLKPEEHIYTIDLHHILKEAITGKKEEYTRYPFVIGYNRETIASRDYKESLHYISSYNLIGKKVVEGRKKLNPDDLPKEIRAAYEEKDSIVDEIDF